MLKRPTFQYRRSQTSGIDFIDLFRQKPGQKPGSKVPSGFDDNGMRISNIKAEHFKQNRICSLGTVGDDNDLYAANL